MGEFGNTRKLDRHGGWVSGSTGPVEKVGTGEQIILQFLFLYEICKRHPKAKREMYHSNRSLSGLYFVVLTSTEVMRVVIVER